MNNALVVKPGPAAYWILLAIPFVSCMVTGATPPPGQSLSDQKVMFAVERLLERDDAIVSGLLDVQVQDGIVTLTGEQDDLLAKKRAADIAEAVKGVRSVINRITLEPSTQTDVQIQTAVHNALQDDPGTSSFPIEVHVSKGIATLTGVVNSWKTGRLATEIAEGVSDVREVDNKITFAPLTSPPPDTLVRADVLARLQADTWLDPGLISVNVQKGRVILGGAVGSAFEKSRAFYDGWVPGVNSVNTDALDIQWWARDAMRRKGNAASPSGPAIEKNIQAAFEDDPRVQPFHLHILEEDHRATLTGIVDNLRAKKAAGQDAGNTWGVTDVENYIKVRPAQRLKDAILTQRVRETIRQDPYLADDEIKVYVRHSVVYLTGGTASRFERLRAEDLATRIKGVVDVRNQIIPSYAQPPKNDREIKTDILTYFLWDPRADRDVHVSVKDGMATLTGSISSWAAREAAEKHAYDGGARNVFNDLIIKP